MQKVIRRTIMAEKQAARRLAKKKEKTFFQRRKNNREQTVYTNRQEIKALKETQANRREDWELGPLAPRRDVGDMKEKYATVSQNRIHGPLLADKEKQPLLNIWGGRYLNLVPNDRVVLLEGRDKGKIGTIKEIDRRRGECTVTGLNLMDVAVPQWMLEVEGQAERPVYTVEEPIGLDKIRLVFPLSDPETGATRDVIVKKVVGGKLWFDRHLGIKKWSRYIPGLDVVIPWPKQEPKEKKDAECDTLRIDVDTKTFMPTLRTPPMPGSVIDELRNKYSIFRTRHEPEYIAAKMEEDRQAALKKKLSDQMRTPLKDINRRERQLRKAKGKGQLTAEMLERIGQVIAKKQQLAFHAAGVSKVGGSPELLAA